MFVALEGIDGTGKTTLASMLRKELEASGYSVFATREPTDSLDIPENLKKSRDAVSGLALFFRFTEDRFAHQEVISRHLEKGEIVLCDRFIMSSMAYQGVLLESYFGGRKKTIDWMNGVSSIIRVRPEITFYIDADPEISMKRIANRGSLTGFEEKEYLSRVRDFYGAIEMQGKETVDGSGTIQDTFSEIKEKLRPALRRS